MKNIAVIFGGTSCERDISVITGVMTANNVDKSKFNVVPVYIADNGFWYTSPRLFDISNYKQLDVRELKRVTFLAADNRMHYVKGGKIKPAEHISAAINCLHGMGGEDGTVSAVMNLSGIAVASPDIASSAISMDKHLTKLFLAGAKIKALPYICLNDTDEVPLDISPLTYPVIVKPARQGSSIGISKAEDYCTLKYAVNFAKKYDEKVIIEQCLTDYREINCAAYSVKGKVFVSECEQPLSTGNFLSFDDKYNGGSRVFPADVSVSQSDRIKSVTSKIYTLLGFGGVIRVDFLVKGKSIYVNEINGVPGSLAYYLFCDTFSDFSNIITSLIEQAEKTLAVKRTLKNKFASSVLMIDGAKGGKRL